MTISDLKQQFAFSQHIVKHHIECVWKYQLKEKAHSNLIYLKNNSGTLLRGDHTYKFVKSLGGYDHTLNTWVYLAI